MQGVKESLMDTGTKYVFDAERTYSAVSDTFRNAGFSKGNGIAEQASDEKILQILKEE